MEKRFYTKVGVNLKYLSYGYSLCFCSCTMEFVSHHIALPYS